MKIVIVPSLFQSLKYCIICFFFGGGRGCKTKNWYVNKLCVLLNIQVFTINFLFSETVKQSSCSFRLASRYRHKKIDISEKFCTNYCAPSKPTKQCLESLTFFCFSIFSNAPIGPSET